MNKQKLTFNVRDCERALTDSGIDWLRVSRDAIKVNGSVRIKSSIIVKII
jgi:hypothetical protein